MLCDLHYKIQWIQLAIAKTEPLVWKIHCSLNMIFIVQLLMIPITFLLTMKDLQNLIRNMLTQVSYN